MLQVLHVVTKVNVVPLLVEKYKKSISFLFSFFFFTSY